MSKYSDAYVFLLISFIMKHQFFQLEACFDFPRVYKLLMTFAYHKFFSLGCQNFILKVFYTIESGRSHRTQPQSHESVTHISTPNLVPIKSECRFSYIVHLRYLM